MKLQAWDPDLQTLWMRMKSEELNLQPDFQRGEVWGDPKKRRLIDTILREWHIPPVHVVVDMNTGLQEVLDGQQRLVAIRDFILGEITVDGGCQPFDDEINSLDGLVYCDLPDKFRRRFDTYSLRVIKVTDFRADEPGELFYRLNQPSSLTAAEQRNAFYGKARAQVKKLVAEFAEYGIDDKVLGFKNSRMAYDDVVAKVCYSHHVGDLRTKVTGGVVTALFRSDKSFDDVAVERVRNALVMFGRVCRSGKNIKFNKATFYSWLVFISLVQKGDDVLEVSDFADFMYAFETRRQEVRDSILVKSIEDCGYFDPLSNELQDALMEIFNDRAASRVADILSVLMRDVILWVFYRTQFKMEICDDCEVKDEPTLESLIAGLARYHGRTIDVVLERFIQDAQWGAGF